MCNSGECTLLMGNLKRINFFFFCGCYCATIASVSTYIHYCIQDLEQERNEKDSLITKLTDMKDRLSEQEANSSKAISEVKDQKNSTKVKLTRDMDAYKVSE